MEKTSEYETVKEEHTVYILTQQENEGEENSKELLNIFSQEAEQEMTVSLKLAAEDETYSMDFADLYEELKALERRVMVQNLHIR
jgi:hypothetical protein